MMIRHGASIETSRRQRADVVLDGIMMQETPSGHEHELRTYKVHFRVHTDATCYSQRRPGRSSGFLEFSSSLSVAASALIDARARRTKAVPGYGVREEDGQSSYEP